MAEMSEYWVAKLREVEVRAFRLGLKSSTQCPVVDSLTDDQVYEMLVKARLTSLEKERGNR